MVNAASFHAHWNATNRHLNTSASEDNRITEIARAAILPAANFLPEFKDFYRNEFDQFWFGPLREDNAWLRSHFTAEKHAIETPDGVVLHAVLFRHKASPLQTQLLFQPNASIADEDGFQWLMHKSIELDAPSNFVIFDYRGTGNSKGQFKTTDQLILDGSSIVQWVNEGLNIPNDQVNFFGFSLGGGISLNTQALDPKLIGRNVNLKSFSSITAVGKKAIHEYIYARLPFYLKPFVCLLGPALKIYNLDLDSVAPFKRIKTKKLVVYHPDDTAIPYPVSLAKKVQNAACEILELQAKPRFIDYARVKGHHCVDLNCYYAANSQENAIDRIARFALGIK